jgi:hypothetical protein
VQLLLSFSSLLIHLSPNFSSSTLTLTCFYMTAFFTQMTKGNRRVATWNRERLLRRCPYNNDNRRDHCSLSRLDQPTILVRTLRGNLHHGKYQPPHHLHHHGQRQSPVSGLINNSRHRCRHRHRLVIHIVPPRAPTLLLQLPAIGIPTRARAVLPLPLLHPTIATPTRAIPLLPLLLPAIAIPTRAATTAATTEVVKIVERRRLVRPVCNQHHDNNNSNNSSSHSHRLVTTTTLKI